MQKITQRKGESFYVKLNRWLFSTHGSGGLLMKLLTYGLLIGIGFIYLYPVIYLGVYSFKTLDDLLNPLVDWIPSQLYLGNYKRAVQVLNYLPTLWETLYVTILPSVIQTLIASVIGYGLARFN